MEVKTMPGSLCLTFDDCFVDNWYAARSLFKAYQCKVTFCVSHLHELPSDKCDKLHEMRADGHEIAFHTRNHCSPSRYINRFGLDKWYHDEIKLGVENHQRVGLPPQSYASPFHDFTDDTLNITTQFFCVTRAGGPPMRKGADVRGRIYTAPNNVVHCAGSLDTRHIRFSGWTSTVAILKQTRILEGRAVFIGHNIQEAPEAPGFYTTHDDLEHFLDLAAQQNLNFCTLKEMNTPFDV